MSLLVCSWAVILGVPSIHIDGIQFDYLECEHFGCFLLKLPYQLICGNSIILQGAQWSSCLIESGLGLHF